MSVGGWGFKMRQRLLACAVCLVFLCACANAYRYDGPEQWQGNGYSVRLEHPPESEAAEVAMRYWWYDMTGDFDTQNELLAEPLPPVALTVRKERYAQRDWLESLTIHSARILSEKEYRPEDAPYFYYEIDERVQEYGLSEFFVVSVEFTQTYTPEGLSKGPLNGDGHYAQNVLVGRTEQVPSLKIYTFGALVHAAASEAAVKPSL